MKYIIRAKHVHNVSNIVLPQSRATGQIFNPHTPKEREERVRNGQFIIQDDFKFFLKDGVVIDTSTEEGEIIYKVLEKYLNKTLLGGTCIIASNYDKSRENGALFWLHNNEETAKKKVSERTKKNEVYDLIKDLNLSGKEQLCKCLGIGTRGLSEIQIIEILQDVVEGTANIKSLNLDTITKVLKSNDESKEILSFIYDLEDKYILRKENNSYVFNEETIAVSKEDLVLFIKDAKNKKLVTTWKAQLNSKELV